jgi:hypothetical protein
VRKTSRSAILRQMLRRFAIVLAVVATASAIAAQEVGTKISVLGYADYYWVVNHHDPSVENVNGFWFRRLFLTIDKTIDKSLSARLRFEANSPGDFKSTGILQPYIRDAWLSWKQSEALTLVGGLSPEPLIQSSEDFWGYRSLEKAPLDLYRMIGSRDIGLALRGRIQPKLRYHAMFGNGSGLGGEVDSDKQVSVMFGFDPTAAYTVEVSGAYNSTAGQTRATAQLVAGAKVGKARFGTILAHQDRGDTNLDVATVFGVVGITPKVNGIVRIDKLFDPVPDGAAVAFLPLDPNAKATLLIAAVEWRLHRYFGLMPNVEYVHYNGQAGSTAPADDVIPRLTFHATF